MNKIYNWEIVGERIKKARKLVRLTQRELGDKIDYEYQMVGKWERGESHPSLDTLFSLCNIFGCELGYLLGEYDCYTREATDIQALTGLSEQAIERLKHIGCVKLSDGYCDISRGLGKNLLNAFLESKEFVRMMQYFQHYYTLDSSNEDVTDTLDGEELTGADLSRAYSLAAAAGLAILEKKDAAEFYLSLAADIFKQFARKMVEERGKEFWPASLTESQE